jgi:hypothetical protein
MDKLFKSDNSPWRANACLNWRNQDVNSKWSAYADGYKEAADVLVEYAKENRSQIDFLVYPIVFNYRHYLELRLKELILKGRELYDIEETLKTNHNLLSLWTECREILERVWPKGPKKDLDKIGSRINEFHEKDATSYSFRYPVKKDGQETIPDLTHINLIHLSDKITEMSELLDGASCGIDEYISHKDDMRRDYGY